MQYSTILIEKSRGITTITLNRVENRNSINQRLLDELQDILTECEQDEACKLIVLQGKDGFFCTGMDFEEASDNYVEGVVYNVSNSQPYMDLLRRLRSISKVVISIVDGKVLAGGVGIVAASDIVLSTPRSDFGLSEALWGLMPSMVLPFLVRRTGIQFAYLMTLTTLTIGAEEAYKHHLVDCLTENPQAELRKYFLRLSKINSKTVANIKEYFKKIWIITKEMEDNAVETTDRLTSDPENMNNIYNYQKFGVFPWD